MAELKSPVTLPVLLRGCTKKWIEVLAGDCIEDLKQILDAITVRRHYPAAEDIFAFARYSLNDAKVVILATDPYPNGSAFSTKGTACLNRIWHLLKDNDLISEIPAYDPVNLEHWAAQGVVMINYALTVEPQKPGSHIKLWQPYMEKMLPRLSTSLSGGTVWCLWGSDAQKCEILIDNRHTVLKWCHPTNPGFSKCDHFRIISSKWPIIWDPALTDTHFYTDGAAKDNQKNTCRAAWGVICAKGLYKGRSWGGVTATKTITGPVPKATKKTGETRAYKLRSDGLADIEARPSNIRSEGEALIKAMRIALTLPKRIRITIHTDSKFWMTDMLGESDGMTDAPKSYMAEWQSRGIPWIHRANSDLTETMWNLFQNVKQSGNIRFKFVRCWHDRNRPTNAEDLENWLGNKAAEERAEAALD